MHRSLLVPMLLFLAGCPPSQAPPVPSAPAPTLSFVSPVDGAVENPVQFTVQAHEDVAFVRYVADDLFNLGSSEERGSGFTFGMDFAILGSHTMAAVGYDADGRFVAEDFVTVDVLPDPTQLNELGTWLQPADLEEPGYSHGAMAARLGETGVKRVYIPVGDGVPDCVASPVLCDHDATDAFRAVGVEPWAWMRADATQDGGEQAETLREAVPAGYHGLVIELGDGYNADPDTVESLLAAMLFVRSQCDTTGLHLGGNFPLYLSTELPPWERAIPLASLDPAIDGYMPRVRIEDASPDQGADPTAWGTELLCAWRGEGAQKPVHHVLVPPAPADHDAQVLDDFVGIAGREASIYSTPTLNDDAGWAAFGAIDWWGGDFGEPDCDGP